MRSRYTAFVRGDLDHIDRTWAREKREAAGSALESVEWIGLEIFRTTRGDEQDDTGTVEFAARYRKNGAQRVHRERSNFRRQEGRWVYVDGVVVPEPAKKVGRNAPCPCGSGKKFKRCCGA